MSQPSTIIRITFYVKAISPAEIYFYLSITQRITALLVVLGLIVPNESTCFNCDTPQLKVLSATF